MYNKVRKNLLPISIILIVLTVFILIKFGLDNTQKIFSILGSVSIAIALWTYFYNKNQDKTSGLLEQISFFREKIIPEWDRVNKIIKIKNPTYGFFRVNLHKQKIEEIRHDVSTSKNFNSQLEIFFDISDNDPEKWSTDSMILDQQVLLLNMLEDFSIKVVELELLEHPTFCVVYQAFIDIIEKNAVALVFMRDIVTNNPIYSFTLLVYNSWVNKVKKTNFTNNLEKHGFITKDQKNIILKKQRENTRILNP
jgi:hypothetical protein